MLTQSFSTAFGAWSLLPRPYYLAIAAFVFIIFHRSVSGSSLRHVIVRKMGEGAFQRGFAAASVVLLGWLIHAYVVNRAGSEVRLPHRTVWILWLLAVFAVCLIVAGLTTRNPTTAGMGERVNASDAVHGVIRVTRHPFLIGVSVLSALHMFVLRNPAAWLFYGALLYVAISGMRSIDRKRHITWGADWLRFSRITSVLPFWAMLRGKQNFRGSEFPAWQRIAFVVVSAGVILWHRTL